MKWRKPSLFYRKLSELSRTAQSNSWNKARRTQVILLQGFVLPFRKALERGGGGKKSHFSRIDKDPDSNGKYFNLGTLFLILRGYIARPLVDAWNQRHYLTRYMLCFFLCKYTSKSLTYKLGTVRD
jgi:hypothetical protein